MHSESCYHFRSLEEAQALAAANKRVSNILSKSEEKLADNVLASVLKTPEEVKLATHVVVLQDKLAPMFAERNYQEALVELASLRDIVDEFFANVMVMDEDQAVRINRLTLLSQLRELFLK